MLGILASAGALVIESIWIVLFSISNAHQSSFSVENLPYFLLFLAIGAFAEELLKFIFLFKRLRYVFLDKKNFFENVLIFGSGFAFFELLLIYQNSSLNEMFFDFSGIMITGASALHILTAVIIGYFIYVEKETRKMFIKAIAFSFLIHLAYNLFIFLS